MKTINLLLFFLVVLFCVYSCKTESKKDEISDRYKLETLNSILQDTLDLKILGSKKRMISNTVLLFKEPLNMEYFDSLTNEFKKANSFSSFLSEVLNSDKDTLFIKEQIERNKSFKLDSLSNYGYQMIDLKKEPYSSDYLVVSKPIFNKSLDKVFLRVRNGSSGYSLVLEKKNDKWVKLQELNSWIE